MDISYSKIIGKYIVFAGAFFLLIWLPIRNLLKKAKCSQVVNAEIVDIYKNIDIDSETGKNSESYFPIYRYSFHGESFHYISKYSRRFEPDVGKIVKLRVNPDNPNQVYENPGIVVSAALFIFGIILLLIGLNNF